MWNIIFNEIDSSLMKISVRKNEKTNLCGVGRKEVIYEYYAQ